MTSQKCVRHSALKYQYRRTWYGQVCFKVFHLGQQDFLAAPEVSICFPRLVTDMYDDTVVNTVIVPGGVVLLSFTLLMSTGVVTIEFFSKERYRFQDANIRQRCFLSGHRFGANEYVNALRGERVKSGAGGMILEEEEKKLK